MSEHDLDGSQWELSKENIQPIKQGRKQSILTDALNESQQRNLSIIKQEFEKELRSYNGDDPLDVWYRYILWVEQSYPKGGSKGNLYKLTENCITALCSNTAHEAKYRNDKRFLDIWIKYINQFPSPLDVYQALNTKNMLTELSSFFENWAWEMEKLGNLKKANAIYLEGIERGAKPTSSLEIAYTKFQSRIAQLTLEGLSGSENENALDEQRKAFAALQPKGPKGRTPADRVSTVIGTTGKFSSMAPKVNVVGPNFKIFQDENEIQDPGAAPTLRVGPSELPLPTQMSTKENERSSSMWTKNRVKQRTTAVVPVENVDKIQKPSFSVHVDENPTDSVTTPAKPSEFSGILSSRKRKKEDWHVPLFIAEPFNPNAQPQYCKQLVYCGNEEFSFEELRALAVKRREEKENEQRRKKENEQRKKEENEQRKKAEKDGAIEEELKTLREMFKKQQELISSLLQTKKSEETASKKDEKHSAKNSAPSDNPTITISESDTVNSLAKLAKSKTRLYEDSWVAINKSVSFAANATQNCSNVLDESSTKALLSYQPAPSKNAEFLTHQPCKTGSGPSTPASTNSSLKDVRSPTVNTKFANNLVTEFFSRSLFSNSIASGDSKYLQPGPDVNSDIKGSFPLCEDKTVADNLQPLAAFPIYQDENGVPPPFSIYQDENEEPPTFQIYKDENKVLPPFPIYQDENAPLPAAVIKEISKQKLPLRPIAPPAAQVDQVEPFVNSDIRSAYEDENKLPTQFFIYHNENEPPPKRYAQFSSGHNEKEHSGKLSTQFTICHDNEPVKSLTQSPIYFDENKAQPTESSDEVPIYQYPASKFPDQNNDNSTIPSSLNPNDKWENKFCPEQMPCPQENQENEPPEGYFQVKEARILSGILKPSNGIPYIPLEEQLETDLPNDELEGIEPLTNTDGPSDFTMVVPKYSEAFAKKAFVASTPRPLSFGLVPQGLTEGDDFTMAAPIQSLKKLSIVTEERNLDTCKKQILEDEEKREEDKTSSKEDKPAEYFPVLCRTEAKAVSTENSTMIKNAKENAGKVNLSPIFETSKECRLSSSSSGCTTFGTHSNINGFSHISHGSKSITFSHYKGTFTTICTKNGSSLSDYQVDATKSGYIAEDATKSGYVADHSRGLEVTREMSTKKPKMSKGAGTSGGDSSFDPSLVAKRLLGLDSDMFSVPSSKREDPPLLDFGEKMEKMPKLVVEDSEQPSPLREPLDLTGDIDPFCEVLRSKILDRLKVPINTRAGYVTLEGKMPLIKPKTRLSFGKEMYHVKRLCGAGAYAQIFHASTLDPMNVTVMPLDSSDDEDDDEAQMILKVQKPPCFWEFYICHELRERLKAAGAPQRSLEGFMRINRGYFSPKGSILVSQYHKQGTILDMVNKFKNRGKSVPEKITYLLMREITKCLQQLHSCGIIHGDLKPDNVLLSVSKDSLSVGTLEEFDSLPSIIKIIDFGRSIDMQSLRSGVTFTRKVTTDGFTCCEMRENRPWTFQTDYFGLAAIAHTMLWGSYMNVKKDGDKWDICGVNYYRYITKSFWQKFFRTILNVSSCSHPSPLNEILHDFEDHLNACPFTSLDLGKLSHALN